MAFYRYQGRRLAIAPTADMPLAMRPGKRHSRQVQHILDTMGEWEPGLKPIETMEFPGKFIIPMAVPVAEETMIQWGLHRGHHSSKRQLSPFVDSYDLRTVETNLLTIELIDSPRGPMLVRAYGGDYAPPLPWMSTAPSAEGGREACEEFWHSHAYFSPELRLVEPNSLRGTAPEWFTNN